MLVVRQPSDLPRSRRLPTSPVPTGDRLVLPARGRARACRLLLALLVASGTGLAWAEAEREAPPLAVPPAAAEKDGSRDFDFEFGAWKVQLSRRLAPLTGSTAWVEYEGTSVVRKVWDGRANLGELQVGGAPGRIEGLSLRLYDPRSRQWSIRWANSRDGELGEPMVGGFRDGVGEFYNQELFDGRSIFVRFVFSDITPTSFRLEQAFSADGGKSWEANWIARFQR